MFRKQTINLLKKVISLSEEEIDSLLEVPPNNMGDLAFPCFTLAKTLKKAPGVIAKETAGNIKVVSPIEKVESNGPYINFFFDKNIFSDKVISEILEEKNVYGSCKDNKSVMVEYPGPNTNKPLHLGHIRNMLLGGSVCNILAFCGMKMIPVDIVNDRGIHICKSMLAYKKYGKGKVPEKKSDHFVGDFYVLYNEKVKENPKLEDEAKEMLLKWEAGDKETRLLWSKMNHWAIEGMKETYAKFDVFHKKSYLESEMYLHGKDVVDEGLDKGVFKKRKDGAVIVDLTKDGFDEKVLLRSDGTGVYITQDLYLGKKRFEDFKPDQLVYVVANEQDYHFKVLFKIFKLLGYDFADNCHHLSYGMVNLPSGKMKSREGTVVDADNLVVEVKELAKKEILKRHKSISKDELEKRSEIIGMGALKFFVLKFDPIKDFTYNPEESVSFEGETGPYVQYAHARICSILRSAGKFKFEKKFFHQKEYELVKLLGRYPEVVVSACKNYKPSLVARYCLDLAQCFNEFYQECPVIKGDNKASRLTLVTCVKFVLSSGLDLLGIKAPEEM